MSLGAEVEVGRVVFNRCLGKGRDMIGGRVGMQFQLHPHPIHQYPFSRLLVCKLCYNLVIYMCFRVFLHLKSLVPI